MRPGIKNYNKKKTDYSSIHTSTKNAGSLGEIMHACESRFFQVKGKGS